MKKITKELILKFGEYLQREEKAAATMEKYIRDMMGFALWIGELEVSKERVLEYKNMLIEHYAPASVNSILSSLNCFFSFSEWFECRVKTIKTPKRIFSDKAKELNKEEYERLLDAAKQKKNQKLYLLMQTICATGIRVSEVKYITVEAVMAQQAIINCKGKMRVVILPRQLCKMLIKYIKSMKIKKGSIFISRNGNPLNRSNIWKMLKSICNDAGVENRKVFPHNLRHLFARTYYSIEKDIVRLADILGHISINTTRIYTMENGDIHRQQIQRLGLLRC